MTIKHFKVEDFIEVREHQSWALNHHLKEMINTFDFQYSQSNGVLGSPSHQFEREFFAKSVCESLKEFTDSHLGNITALETRSVHFASSINTEITVKSKSIFKEQSEPKVWWQTHHLN